MIHSMATLMRRNGYAATGWRNVIAQSGAPWGSQAHHFPGGKEQLASEAIERSAVAHEHMLRAALADSDPADAVMAWAKLAARQLEASGYSDGCPIGTVALEQSATSGPLAAACASAFQSWRETLAEALASRGLPTERADSLATLALAGIEGGLMLSRAAHNTAALRAVGTELAAVIRASLGNEASRGTVPSR
jgi:TetR/AcrR family transcriptional repressor of lmrAB and yxaGH operons